MNEISGQACLHVLQAAQAAGYATEGLLESAGIERSSLASARSRMSWDAYVELLEAMERRGLTPSDFETIGRLIPTVPSMGAVGRVARSIVSVKALYWLGYHWAIPSLFPHLRTQQRSAGDHRIELDVEIPLPYRPSSIFFYVFKGTGQGMPVILGLPPATVEADIAPRRASFRVTAPPEGPFASRLRRAARSFLAPWAMVEELGRQQAQLTESYRELMRSRLDFQIVIERIPDAVVVHRDGIILYANPALARALGLSGPASLTGRALADFVQPADRAAAKAHFEGSCDEQHEIQFLRPEGSTVVLEVAPMQEIVFENRPALLAVARDTTDRRELQDRLAFAARMTDLGRLAASVGHELNNPLAYVDLNLKVLDRHLGALPPDRRDEAGQALRAARDGTARAAAIVKDLSTFSRPEQETTEPVDLRKPVQDVLEMMHAEIDQRAHLVTELSDVPCVRINPGRFKQVVVNLLLNALHSFGDRPRGENRIELRTFVHQGRVCVEVEDNGAGIPDSVRDRIFDPFFTTRDVQGGTGLGLAICHQIVNRAGGDIAFDSEPGRGTRFRVSLPPDPVEERAGSRPGPSSTPADAPPRARVLVIDDEPALASALHAFLSDFHDVDVVSSGAGALDRLGESGDGYDLVLCDLMMVDLTGMELYHRIKARWPGLEERIVFMTGGAFTPAAREFLGSVPNRCLEKPFDIDRLLELIADGART